MSKNSDESTDGDGKVSGDKMEMWVQQTRKSPTSQGIWIFILMTIKTP